MTANNRWLASLAGLAGLALAAGPAASASWDMPTPYPEGNFHTQNIYWFAEQLEEATNGEITINVHSNASLFAMPEIKRAVRTRQVQIGELLLSAYAADDRMLEPDGLPFLAVGYDEARALWEAQRPALEERLLQEDLRILYSVPWPGQGIYVANAIQAPETDFQGLRFRVYNDATAAFAEGIGAEPTRIEAAEVPTAFATGLVDAMITSAQTGVDSAAWDFVDHYYDTQAMHPKNAVIINERVFQGLDPQIQETILEIAAEAEERGWQLSREAMEEATRRLAEEGMQAHEPSPEIVAFLQEQSQSIIDEWLERVGADGEPLVQAVLDHRAAAGGDAPGGDTPGGDTY
jgi:TRAP-type transport system periplasmic protein